jgi:site-specific recombinase XerD
LLDTGLRASELVGLTLDKVWIDDGLVKVLGKGNKERLVPMGATVQKAVWRYLHSYRPKPANPLYDTLFLTANGEPLTVNRLECIIERYGKKAEIEGVRLSPHTLRHTAAVSFLRNNGDVFSLQRMLGHSSLEMTRHYCNIADIDVKKAHLRASPVDNLKIRINQATR